MQLLLSSSAAVIALVLAAAAHSLPVYGTSALGELTGTRDVHVSVGPPGAGGLTGFGQYADAAIDFRVDWVITLGPVVHYQYTFTGLNGSGQFKDINHFTLDLSDDCASDPLCVTNAKLNGSAIGAGSIEFGDKDGIIGAVKFDLGAGEGVTYEFDSNRLPVYGHLAIKDGGGNGTCPAPGSTTVACSNGLVAGVDTEDINDYVARPNGIVPEPSPASLMVLGLLALCAARRRVRRAD
jgi:hypothetical protein